MGSIVRSVFIAATALGVAACGGVTSEGTGGSGDTGGVGGSGGVGATGGSGTGGVSGTGGGGTGGTPAPSVEVTATPGSVETGGLTTIAWAVTNADSCTATQDWQGTRSVDGGAEDFFIFQDRTYQLMCTGPGGNGSDEVDVLLGGSQLMISVDMDVYVFKAGDTINVNTTVSNPNASETVDDVFVNLTIPEFVTIDAGDLPDNAICTGTGTCLPGEQVQWDLGNLQAGAVTVVSVTSEVAAGVPPDAQIDFETGATATGEPDALAMETTVEGESDLSLGLIQTPAEPEAGDEITYSLTYENISLDPLPNVVLTLVLPAPVEFDGATDGGTEMDGVVTWDLGTLAAGASGTVDATVTVDSQLPAGAQLRAEASMSVDGITVPVRATALGAVTDLTPACVSNNDCAVGDFCVRGECTPPLLAEVSVDAAPVVEGGELFRVSVTVTNPTETETVNGADVEIELPEGITAVNVRRRSVGGTCTTSANFCDGGERLNWLIGSLDPGESRVVSFEPITQPNTAGNPMTFRTRVTSNNAKTANDEVTVDVVASRDLNVRIVESSNPVAPGQTLTYTLHYANQSNSTINDVRLQLTVPTEAATITDAGGGTEAQGMISWNVGRLDPGEGGTRHAMIAIEADEGEQVGAVATVFDATAPLEATDARAQTPIADSPFVAFVEINPDPSRQNELTNVSVTITNPSATVTRNDVQVLVRLPDGLTAVNGRRRSVGGTCSVSANFCDGGENLSWMVGSLAPGESRVVSFEPIIAGSATDGLLMLYQADIRENAASAETAVEQTSVLASATAAVRGERKFNLHAIESSNPVASGEALTYTLHYANQSNLTINDVELRLTTPSGDTTVTDTGGGTHSQGTISWQIGPLNPGEGGIREATVTVNAAAGSQLRTEAVIVDLDDLDEETRATVQTPVGERPLLAVVEVNPDPSPQGELTNVSVTVSNPSTTITRNNINVEVRLPEGITAVNGARRSEGGTCTVSANFCDGGENLSWMVGSLEPGESRVVSFEPIIAGDAVAGLLLPYQADVRENAATDEMAVEQTAVLAAGAAAVRGDRTFNLRVVEDANPIVSGGSLTYTLHFANQSNSTINDVELSLSTPAGATTITDTGGGSESQSVITWDLDSLSPGQSGTRQAVVTVDAALGEQVRVDAVLLNADDPADQTRAVVQTPIGGSTLVTTMAASQNPVQPGEQFTLTVTVENVSLNTTENLIEVQLQLPLGIASIPPVDRTGDATCTASANFCDGGETITWNIDSLIPGESTNLDLQVDPTVQNATPPGSLLLFETQTLVGDPPEPRVVAGTTVAVE